jgi:hypothetical protein
VAAAALASIVLGLAGLILQVAAGGRHAHLVDTYRDLDSNKAILIASYACQALSALAIAPVLRFLYRAARYRDPDSAPRIAWILATAAPIVLALASMGLAAEQLAVTDRVLDSLPLSEAGIEDIQDSERQETDFVVVLAIGALAALSLAAAFVLISRFARRAGLLSGFMGILGIIVGAAFVLGALQGQVLGALPIVQWFWLGAVGVLIAGRWPGQRGPAWETGEPDPWPSAAEQRAAAAEARGEEPTQPARRRGPSEPAPELVEEDLEPEEPGTPAHPRSKKRKRKRRR